MLEAERACDAVNKEESKMMMFLGAALFGFGVGIIISHKMWKEDREDV